MFSSLLRLQEKNHSICVERRQITVGESQKRKANNNNDDEKSRSIIKCKFKDDNNNDDEKKTKLLNTIAKLTIIMMMKKWRSVTNIGVAHVVTITYSNRFLNYFIEI